MQFAQSMAGWAGPDPIRGSALVVAESAATRFASAVALADRGYRATLATSTDEAAEYVRIGGTYDYVEVHVGAGDAAPVDLSWLCRDTSRTVLILGRVP